MYKHCWFEKGLDACRTKCNSELNNSNAIFKDFKATITKTVVGVIPTFVAATNNNENTTNDTPIPPKVVEDDDDVDVGPLFPDNVW